MTAHLSIDLATSVAVALVDRPLVETLINMPSVAFGVPGPVGPPSGPFTSVFAFMSAAQIADVMAFAYSMDVSAPIQAAINSLPVTGGDVFLPRGGYRINSSINIGNGGAAASTRHGVRLLGEGVGWTTQTFSAGIDGPTTLKLYGTAHAGGAVMINGPINGAGLSNICFEFNGDVGPVARAIVDVGCCGGDFRNIRINQPSDFGIIETTSPLSPADHNTWENVYIRFGHAGTNSSPTGQGIVITGNAAGGDRWSDSWKNVRIVPSFATQIAIHLQYCDSIAFENVEIPLVAPGVFCIPLLLDYTLVANFPNACIFTQFDPSGGVVADVGTVPTNPGFVHKFYGFNQTNGAPLPTIGNVEVFNTGSAVTYAKAQTLTVSEQAVARSNIHAAPFDALAFNGFQINGAMEVSQEVAGNAVTAVSAAYKYGPDGWAAFYTSSSLAVSIQQITSFAFGPAGEMLPSWAQLKADTGAALGASDVGMVLTQAIEGVRALRLGFGGPGAQSITISFWVWASIAGIATLSVKNAANNRTYLANFTINAAATWEYKTVTVPGDTTGTWLKTNGIGLRLSFCFGTGSGAQGTNNAWNAANRWGTASTTNFGATTNNFIAVTGVVVVPGTQGPESTSLSVLRPSDTEILLCQRHYWKSFPYNEPPRQASFATGAVVFTATGAGAVSNFSSSFDFARAMRATPSMLSYNPQNASAQIQDHSAGQQFSGTNFPSIGDERFCIAGVGHASTAHGNILSVHVTADARL